MLVGAVAVEEAGGRGRGRRPGAPPGRPAGRPGGPPRWAPGAVGGVGPQPVGAVAGRVVAAEHGLALAQGGVPGGQVGVVDGAGRDQRGLLDSAGWTSGLGVRALPGDRGVLVGRPTSQLPPSGSARRGRRRRRPDRHDAQARLGLEPLGHHQPPVEDVHVVEAGAGAVVEDRPPPCPAVAPRPGRPPTGSRGPRRWSASEEPAAVGPAPARCSTAYSTPWRRGWTTRAGAPGRRPG